jgi:tetratricopeptide (TPR) repeat protein
MPRSFKRYSQRERRHPEDSEGFLQFDQDKLHAECRPDSVRRDAPRDRTGFLALFGTAVLLVWACLAVAQGGSLDRVWSLLAKGQRPEAVRLLHEMINANPRDVEARVLLGSVLMEESNAPESLAQLTEAVRLRPDWAQAQNALGEAFKAFGDPEAARKAFEKAAECDPRFAQAQINLGLVLTEGGELSLAVPHLNRAIQLLGQRPEAAYPHYLLAKIYSDQAQVKKAAAELQQAVSLQPDFAEAWSDLGSVRKTFLDEAGALAAFEKAVQLAPNDPVAQTRLGTELLGQGKAHEAVPHLQEAVRLGPANQSALYNLHRALVLDGHSAEAETVKEKLNDLLRRQDQDDQNAVAGIQLNNQGAALEKAGNLRGALEKYRAALERYPEHVGIRLNFAIALLRLGQWEQGIAELREVVRRDPNNLSAKKALEQALARAPR